MQCALLGGCPRRFDAAATPSVASKDPEATRAFKGAKQRFDDGDHAGAEKAFTAFVARFAGDPLATLARVYLGRLALLAGRLPAAREQLKPVTRSGAAAEDLSRLASYYLGLVAVREGDHAEGRKLLTPFLEDADEQTRAAVLVALAKACEAQGEPLTAARHLDRLHRESQRAAERLYARRHLERLIDQLQPASLATLTRAADGSLLFALAARRQIAELVARGKRAAAEALRSSSSEARAQHRVDAPGTAAAGGPIGLLVPFDGRYRSAGKLALAGAIFGSSALQRDKQSQSPPLVVRDSSQQPAKVARELIERDRVVALIGVLDPAAADAVARVAGEQRVPFLSLSSRAPASATNTTLRLLPGSDERARSLARRLVASSQTPPRVAVFAPDGPYGRAMARAFAGEARKRGARLVAERFYPPGLRSFTEQSKALAKLRIDALFIPDSARRLALITPALALAGLWVTPAGGQPTKGRGIRLAATADGLSTALLDRAARYVQGALLAPGFFPDPAAAASGAEVRRYRQANGRDPGIVEAFAADAVATVSALLRGGARGRAGLLAALRSRGTPGLTGKVRFTADGRRADPPLIYRVSGRRILLIR